MNARVQASADACKWETTRRASQATSFSSPIVHPRCRLSMEDQREERVHPSCEMSMEGQQGGGVHPSCESSLEGQHEERVHHLFSLLLEEEREREEYVVNRKPKPYFNLNFISMRSKGTFSYITSTRQPLSLKVARKRKLPWPCLPV